MMEILKTSVPRITPSSVNDLECPAKFKRLRVDRDWPTREPILAVAHGTAVHWVLRQVYQARRGGEIALENVEALARDAIRRGRYPREIDRHEQVNRVLSDVCAFVGADDYGDIEGTLHLEIQGQFEVREGGVPLYLVSATLDRSLVREAEPDRLVVRENKTGSPRVDLRVALISLWVAKKLYPGFREYGLEVDSFDEDHRVVRDVITGKQVNGQHAIITEMARRVFAGGRRGEWPKVPGDQCCYCPSREICQGLEAEELVEGEAIF